MGQPLDYPIAPSVPSEVAGRIRDIWAELLGAPAESMDPDKHFFELGGYSLLALTAMARVNAAFGLSLPMSAILTCKSLSSLVGHVSEILLLKESGKASAIAAEEMEEGDL